MHLPRALFVTIACGVMSSACATPGSKDQDPRDDPQANDSSETQAATQDSADAAREARETFAQRCVVCHGESGAGDGPGSASLTPKPRAFADSEWQDAVSDEHIEKVILAGGAAVGKSPVMPGTPELKKKPAVLSELVQIIRGFEN